MSEVIWLPQSLADIERLHAFLKSHNAEAAARAMRAILAGGNQLREMPAIGRPMDDGTARRELFLPFGSGAYVLRYMLERSSTAIVIRVWHSREERTSIDLPSKE